MKALISNIQKFCVDDGPGIRTVVFFMGCPLRCKWCQNPENLLRKPQMMFDSSKCQVCGACVASCKRQVNTLVVDGKIPQIAYNRDECSLCGSCTEICRNGAREIAGKEMTVQEVFDEVMKDRVFYENTGGGITLSGGECTAYPDFAQELLKKIQSEHIHTAVETCGFCSEEIIEKLASHVDLFLYDFKAFTPEIHKKWTGQDNGIIKKNLQILHSKKKCVIIRIPLIPGVNTDSELEKMAEYLYSLEGIRSVHILPFHQLGSSKYRLSGRQYCLQEMPECTMEEAEKAQQLLEHYRFKVNIGGWDS